MMDTFNVGEILRSLQHTDGSQHELRSLQLLQAHLQPIRSRYTTTTTPNTPNCDGTQFVFMDCSEGNPFPENSITAVFADTTMLNQFVCYVFRRRFGWSESQVMRNTLAQKRLNEKQVKFKVTINELLDRYLLWFVHQPLSDAMLEAFIYAICYAQNKPVVRNQVVIYLMDWLKTYFDADSNSSSFELIMGSLLLSLTDIWSAVRNSCSSRLSYIIEHMNMDQLETFFKRLEKICDSESSSWQAQEGAIMGIHCIIRRFQWVGVMADNDTLHLSSHTKYFLKFNQQQLSAIPEFISGHIHALTFKLLANAQLTIRENAIKAYSSYISKCDFKEALESFKDVMLQLRRGLSLNNTLPHLTILDPNYKFMDAYEADGLLGVCVHLIKQISPGFLLPNWPLHFYTFSLYLMHPASTVRQTTSSIFKFLVAKDTSNPLLVKLVLQGLCSDWHPSMQLLNKPCTSIPANTLSASQPTSNGTHEKALTNVHNDDSSDVDKWEWREGRLLAYELLLRFLIKNFWLYTFGASHLATLSSPRDNSHCVPVKGPTGVSSTKEDPDSWLPVSHPPNEHLPAITPADTSDNQESHVCTGNGGGCLNHSRNSISCTDPLLEKTPYEHRQLTMSCSSGVLRGDGARVGGMPHPDITSAKHAVNNKVSTLAGDGSLSLHTLVRHYTYYSDVCHASPIDVSGVNQTVSLLKHVQIMDAQLCQEKVSAVEEKHLPSADLLKNIRAGTIPNEEDENRVDSGDSEWLNELQLERFSVLLERLFYQTVQSMGDSRWEVRRMGQQLLPVLVEVMRWFDVTILKDLLCHHLSTTPTLLCYASCIALQYSLEHIARLLSLVVEPPTTWQDPDMCCEIISHISNCFTGHLVNWSAIVQKLLLRPVYDKLTAVTLKTLMLICSHFSSKLNCSQICDDIFAVLKSIFSTVHVDNTSMTDINGGDAGQWHHVDVNNFLSCCGKSESTQQGHLQQVEKYILTEIHLILPRFVNECSLEGAASLLPMLCYYVGYYSSDDSLNKQLCDSISTVVARYHTADDETHTDVTKFFVLALNQLSDIISDMSNSSGQCKQALELYLEVSSLLPSDKHLSLILHTVASRLSQVFENEAFRMISINRSSDADLAMCSNDIPVSPRPHEDDNTSDDDDNSSIGSSHDALLAECQTLNLSTNSGSNVSIRRGSLGANLSATSVTSDTDSDWDNWSDEEDEDHDALLSAVSEFMQNMKWRLESEAAGSCLDGYLSQLTTAEQNLLTNIINKYVP